MRHKIRLVFILIFMFMSYSVGAQTSINNLKEANKDFKILLTDIIGNWYAVDSTRSKISFVNLNNVIVEIDGLNEGVGNYSFLVDGDSMSVNGTAANWPPYNCTLRLLNSKHLEIEFYQFFSKETSKIIYRR
jgi:hypothetical protein